mgnify:CR=1 FL=1
MRAIFAVVCLLSCLRFGNAELAFIPRDLVGKTGSEVSPVAGLVIRAAITDTDPKRFSIEMTSDFSTWLTSAANTYTGIQLGWGSFLDPTQTFVGANSTAADWFGFPQIARMGNVPYVNTSESGAGIDLNETHIFNDTYWRGRMFIQHDVTGTTTFNVTMCNNLTATSLVECDPMWDTWVFDTVVGFGTRMKVSSGSRIFAPSSQLDAA